jgi:phosphoglycolate phosphatase
LTRIADAWLAAFPESRRARSHGAFRHAPASGRTSMNTVRFAARAVLFDLDGTFIDSAPDMAAAVNRMRAWRGQPEMPVAALRHCANSGARGMLGAAFGVTPADAAYAALRDEFFSQYESALLVATRWVEGVAELVDTLEARGLRWGIVTNKVARFTVPIAAALSITPRAACLVTGDTTAHPKPHPAPLLHAASLLALSPGDCLYLGDDRRDMAAARAAGMQGVAAGYGYLAPHDDPRTWDARAVVGAPLELLDLLG